MADPAELAERLGDAGAFQYLSPPLQTALFLGVMALLPAALVSLTSFTRIVIVLGFVRRAVTAQEIPPNMVITGFLIYMPFLLVDLVVSSVLTAMGMVMMPPVLISAPFKILLFVLADGWHLVARALSLSFA